MDYTSQCISIPFSSLAPSHLISSRLVLSFLSIFLFAVCSMMMGCWSFDVDTWAGSLIYLGPSVGKGLGLMHVVA
ncbi:hypothetical protein DFJ58DRAFT_459058 [Suillus subalutaceus]|uniref:uncharacterized protein n=1 Tax=Suillus subalutaceus TaxID=48586 RepID=UPI001B875739|nr:uncharacterized protein DFJ58DRAFT_459058 [Suillus subalutaceus]KAG1849168.1 hypothetical protein DFJ58DRAFT_459058 [Suillus subalutaceus]